MLPEEWNKLSLRDKNKVLSSFEIPQAVAQPTDDIPLAPNKARSAIENIHEDSIEMPTNTIEVQAQDQSLGNIDSFMDGSRIRKAIHMKKVKKNEGNIPSQISGVSSDQKLVAPKRKPFFTLNTFKSDKQGSKPGFSNESISPLAPNNPHSPRKSSMFLIEKEESGGVFRRPKNQISSNIFSTLPANPQAFSIISPANQNSSVFPKETAKKGQPPSLSLAKNTSLKGDLERKREGAILSFTKFFTEHHPQSSNQRDSNSNGTIFQSVDANGFKQPSQNPNFKFMSQNDYHVSSISSQRGSIGAGSEAQSNQDGKFSGLDACDSPYTSNRAKKLNTASKLMEKKGVALHVLA